MSTKTRLKLFKLLDELTPYKAIELDIDAIYKNLKIYKAIGKRYGEKPKLGWTYSTRLFYPVDDRAPESKRQYCRMVYTKWGNLIKRIKKDFQENLAIYNPSASATNHCEVCGKEGIANTINTRNCKYKVCSSCYNTLSDISANIDLCKNKAKKLKQELANNKRDLNNLEYKLNCRIEAINGIEY